jgi:hypothetical protein
MHQLGGSLKIANVHKKFDINAEAVGASRLRDSGGGCRPSDIARAKYRTSNKWEVFQVLLPFDPVPILSPDGI